MSVLKCKVCGADIQLVGDNKLATCQYCGSTMTIPRLDDEARLAAFNRGNFFRRKGEFDQALSAYERIVVEDNTDAEAHWCCALCRFGIDYVEDPNTYEWIPTCHRVSYDDFLEDIDYKLALEYSDGIARRQYMKDAMKISEVQKRLIAISRNEEAYDIFICYKEQDNAGGRTQDSVIAQDIYQHLTDRGYKVFFSRITLEDKVGAEYEPYIFAALNSAKIMLLVSTRAEYVSAVWVKNEWSRFLTLMRKDHEKMLIPCYKGMDPYDLPPELSAMQALDLDKIGAMQDLYHVIEKNMPVEKQEQQEQTSAKSAAEQANIESRLGVAFMNINAGNLDGLDIKFKEVLELDITCIRAYLGLLIWLDLEKGKNDAGNWHMEWQTYIGQLEQYITEEIQESEKKIVTYQTAPSLLKIYGTLQDDRRTDLVLERYPGLLSDNDLLLAVCRDGNAPLMRKLLDRGLLVDTKVQFQRKEKQREESLLFYTVSMTDSTAIAKLLMERGASAGEMIPENGGADQWPLLYYAIEAGRKEMTELLIQNGADPRQTVCYRNSKGVYREESALFWAIWYADAEMTEIILNAGVSPDQTALAFNENFGIKDQSYFTALVSAITVKKPETVQVLLRHGANVQIRYRDFFENGFVEYSLLGHAVYYGNGPIIKMLIEAGADVNGELVEYQKKSTGLLGGRQEYQEKYRVSPLYGVITEYNRDQEKRAWLEELTRLLLEHGADSNWVYCVKDGAMIKNTLRATLSGYSGKYPVLFQAICNNCSPKVLNLLVQHGAAMNAQVIDNGSITSIKHYPFRGLNQETMQAIKALGWRGNRFF